MEKYGVDAMEVVAMEMKYRGMFIARQLSLNDVTFKVDEVVLTPTFIQGYDESVKLWVDLYNLFKEATSLANPKTQIIIWTTYWLAHQRFFKYLCIAAKVEHAVKLTMRALSDGKCVVIGLQSTGEAATEYALKRKEKITDFVSPLKYVFQSLVDKLPDFLTQDNSTSPPPKKKKLSLSKESVPSLPLSAASTKERLSAKIDQLLLPSNTLDQLIDELGGTDFVADLTARQGRVVKKNGLVIIKYFFFSNHY